MVWLADCLFQVTLHLPTCLTVFLSHRDFRVCFLHCCLMRTTIFSRVFWNFTAMDISVHLLPFISVALGGPFLSDKWTSVGSTTLASFYYVFEISISSVISVVFLELLQFKNVCWGLQSRCLINQWESVPRGLKECSLGRPWNGPAPSPASPPPTVVSGPSNSWVFQHSAG